MRNYPKLTVDFVGQLAMIRPTDDSEVSSRIIYGRVYLYDELTKTLILKVIDADRFKETKEEVIIGMGVYNTANVQWEGVVNNAR